MRREFHPDMPDENFADFFGQWGSAMEKDRLYNYVSCWHMNEHESAAMWEIYKSGQPQGIAIRSTYRNLAESITDERTIYIGTVSYIDFDTEAISDRNSLYPYVHKRKYFEYEREIRAVYCAPSMVPHESKADTVTWGPVGPKAEPISVDLDRLINAVYVSPKAEPWFAELVQELIGL